MKQTALEMYHLNGFEKAREKLVEEVAELLVELIRYEPTIKNEEKLLSEMFDVVFCIEQLKNAFDQKAYESICHYKLEKIRRIYLGD
jgi:NTP pyrophosphatase (non-canonical NTP hydrolase)